jgi:hypothetical protein
MTDGDLAPRPPGGLSEKIFRRHRERLAFVYTQFTPESGIPLGL